MANFNNFDVRAQTVNQADVIHAAPTAPEQELATHAQQLSDHVLHLARSGDISRPVATELCALLQEGAVADTQDKRIKALDRVKEVAQGVALLAPAIESVEKMISLVSRAG